MEESDLSNDYLNKKINLNDFVQIDTLAKLFNCTFDEIYETVQESDGTMQAIVERFGQTE